MGSRFDYVKYDEKSVEQQNVLKQKFQSIELLIESISADSESEKKAAGRSTSSALTYLEIAYMWVGKAIRDAQLARNTATQLQEERDNS